MLHYRDKKKTRTPLAPSSTLSYSRGYNLTIYKPKQVQDSRVGVVITKNKKKQNNPKEKKNKKKETNKHRRAPSEIQIKIGCC